MNFLSVTRAAARRAYAAVRLPLTVLDEYILSLYWEEQAPVRRGFARFLGSVDEAAGWLLAEEASLAEVASPPGDTGAAGDDAPARKDSPARPATQARTIDVVFTLPAEVQASSVALCGEFNQWSAEETWLARGSDGCWRVTVALEPGRSYRYRYLLDGERWENAWDADYYLPNVYGTTDSVIEVA